MLTPTEMEDRLEKLDRRLDRIEQILPTLATKDDLKGFPTKDDLAAYATKDDLKAFATKEDLKAFATKADLGEAVERFTTIVGTAFEQAERNARTLHEDLVGTIKLLGEHRPKRR